MVLMEMLDVPRVWHQLPILGLQADSPRPGDMSYLVRAFPLWRELVYPLHVLDPAQDKVSFLKFPGIDPLAVIAAQPLLVMDLLEEIDIINPLCALCVFIICAYSRGPILEFRG
jgi:hypothetical protein